MSENKRVCEKCREGAEAGKLVEWKTLTFTNKARWICDRCEVKWSVMMIAGVLACFAVGWGFLMWRAMQKGVTLTRPDPFLNKMLVLGLTMMVGPWVMLVVHELAHAVVGAMAGMKLQGISIGRGSRLKRIVRGGMFLDIHLIPTMGVCWLARYKESRWGEAMMIAAGPAVHGAMVVGIWWWGLAGYLFVRESFDFQRTMGQEFWFSMYLMNLGMLVLNLVPLEWEWNGRKMGSDGKRLWELMKG